MKLELQKGFGLGVSVCFWVSSFLPIGWEATGGKNALLKSERNGELVEVRRPSWSLQQSPR